MTRPKKPTKRLKFPTYVDEARYVIANLKGNMDFLKDFLYDYSDGCYNIGPICDIVISQLARCYDCDVFSKEDIGTFTYEKLWDSGTWHNLDTYAEEYSFFTWLFKVIYNMMTKMAEEMGYAKNKRNLTPGNTRLLLTKHSPEGCELFIDELMPKGKHKDLLVDIYVNRKTDKDIMDKLHIDADELKKQRKSAEKHFKTILLESDHNYTDLLLAEKSPRRVTGRIDYDNIDACVENSCANPLGDVLGVCLSDVEVEELSGPFIKRFLNMLKWDETDEYVILERVKGTSPEILAKILGRRRSWVDNRYSRLKKKFAKAMHNWVYQVARPKKNSK